MSVADMLVDTLTVQRKGRVADGQGGFSETFAEVSQVSGRIGIVSGNDQAIAAQKKSLITNAVFTLPGADIREGDRIVSNGRTYDVRVTGVEGPSYPYNKYLVERYIPSGTP